MKQMSGSRLFMIAVVCGVIAAFLTVYYLKSVEEKYRRENRPKVVEKVAVVVPKRNLNKGDTITIDAIGKLDVPKGYLPSHYIPASDYRKILNRTIASPLKAGRVITVEAITGTKADTFSETVDLGRRAFSLKVTKIDSFDGLLRPGDKIDLMGEFDLQTLGVTGGSDQQNSNVVMPVLEDVKVLSAGREDYTGRRYERTVQRNSADGFDMEFTIVTLSLTPREVARVQLAEKTGNIFAVLRHPKDTSEAKFKFLRPDILLHPEPKSNVDIVLDENGNPVGRVVGDNIVDANGKIVGKVVNGKAVGLDGKTLGSIANNVSPDDPILKVRKHADIVRDSEGNVIGRVVDGKIVDREGNVVGHVDANGNAVGLDGKKLGEIEKNVALDSQGRVVDMKKSAIPGKQSRVMDVVRGPDGKILGHVKDGKVVDANGKVIGTVNSDGSVTGSDGKTLGRVDQAVVDADGKELGKVVKVARDANGKVLGRVVDGKVIDKNGKVVGTVGRDGTITDSNGKVLGKVEKTLVDANGKELGKMKRVLRGPDGKILGHVKDGKVVDANGKVIGTVNSDGSVTGTDGKTLGHVEEAVVGADGKELGKVVKVARDANGKVLGRVVDGKVIDKNGKVVGTVGRDGTVTDSNGKVLGKVEKTLVDANGKELGKVKRVLRGPDGKILGHVENGKVVDDQGRVIGTVNDDGSVTGIDGKPLGHVEQAVVGADGKELKGVAQVVRDSNGKIIGRLVDGKVVDSQGHVVGELKNGKVVDANGRVVADNVTTSVENRAQAIAQMREQNKTKVTRQVDYIEFIPGGNDEEGIVPLRRIRLQ